MERGFLFCISFSFLSISALILPDDYSPVCTCFEITDEKIEILKNMGPMMHLKSLLGSDINNIFKVASQKCVPPQVLWDACMFNKFASRDKGTIDYRKLAQRHRDRKRLQAAYHARQEELIKQCVVMWELHDVDTTAISITEFQMVTPPNLTLDSAGECL